MKTNQNIDFPLDADWTTTEIVTVSKLYDLVLAANEASVDRNQLLAAYNAFKTVVSSKGEERQLDRQLQQQADVSIYQTLKQARVSTKKRFSMATGR